MSCAERDNYNSLVMQRKLNAHIKISSKVINRSVVLTSQLYIAAFRKLCELKN